MESRQPKDKRRLVTPKIMCSYPALFEPVAYKGSEKKKYKLQIVIPKENEAFMEEIRVAILTAVQMSWGEEKATRIISQFGVDHPVRDCDIINPDDPYMENCFRVHAKSDNKPGIVDRFKQPIFNAGPEDVYPGCIIRAAISFYTFQINKKGVAVGLTSVMKIADGERIGRSTPEQDFEGYEETEESTATHGPSDESLGGSTEESTTQRNVF